MLSDVLGASMQVVAINNEAYRNATEATVFGPFFVEDSPGVQLGGDIAAGAPGEPCWVEGTVTDTSGKPVPNALIEVWEADQDGRYDVQYSDGRVAARGHLYSEAAGRYRFWAVTPTPYPIPDDGPVGQLLTATGRSPMRASHLPSIVKADGFRTLVTHIFVRGDELLDGDSVFGVKDSLVLDFTPQPPGTPTPDGRDLGDRAWSRVRFDIVLAPRSPGSWKERLIDPHRRVPVRRRTDAVREVWGALAGVRPDDLAGTWCGRWLAGRAGRGPQAGA